MLNVFLFDDNPSNIQEISEIIALQYKNEILINGREYEIITHEANTLQQALEHLLKPENIQKGGIVFLDLAFDPNDFRNMQFFSLRMVEDFKKRLGNQKNNYAFILMTAFDKLSKDVAYEASVVFADLDYFGTIFRKNFRGKSFSTQLAEQINIFTEKYYDSGNGIWCRIESNKFEWLEKNKMMITGRNIKPVWYPNEIIAIELNNESHHLVYPANDPFNPFKADSIRFPNLGDALIQEIASRYKPSRRDSIEYKDLIQLIEIEPLAFITPHKDFLISLVYAERGCSKINADVRRESMSPLHNWATRHDKKSPNVRGGYLEMIANKSILFFPVSLGHDTRNGYYGNLNIQDILSRSTEKWRSWYFTLRQL